MVSVPIPGGDGNQSNKDLLGGMRFWLTQSKCCLGLGLQPQAKALEEALGHSDPALSVSLSPSTSMARTECEKANG